MARADSLNVSGWMSFASTIMLVYAGLLIVAGLAGIFNSEIYLRADQGQFLIYDHLVWGWVHIILGVVFAVTGIGLVRQKSWALFSAALLVVCAILLNLLIVTVYPGWSMLFLLLDTLLLYALMVPGSKGKL
ncbi:MAG: hypothetical protein V4611_02445 [Patescibacteria group bacterium]